ncbi:HAD-IIIC family phosphatase [Frateuria aurantia]
MNMDGRRIDSETLGTIVQPTSILLFGTCGAGHLQNSFPAGCKVDHMLWESFSHKDIPAVDLPRYDAALISLTLRHIMQEAHSPLPDIGASDLLWPRLVGTGKMQAYFDSCAQLICDRVASFAEWTSKTRVFFILFIEPQRNFVGDLFPRFNMDNPAYFVRKLNEVMEAAVLALGQAWCIDPNEFLAANGKLAAQDDYLNHLTHGSYTNDDFIVHGRDYQRLQGMTPPGELYGGYEVVPKVLSAVVQRLFDALAILRQDDAIKLIVIDLDDTLWRGIAAEEETPPWEMIEGWPLGFAEALLVFKARGGILAISSKNDESVAREHFDRIFYGRLRFDDFASIQINFERKSIGIRQILQDVNVLSKNTLFIDDNPREIEEVRGAFPEIRTLSREHLDWRRIILTSPQTQVASLSEESLRRSELVQARVEREKAREGLSKDEWLRSLKLRQRHSLVSHAKAQDFERALELLNKTNQFNTTGRRWTPQELGGLFSDGGYLVCAFLRDRVVDNGLIAVAVVQGARIEQVVLSCRVFGLGVEYALLHTVTSRILGAHAAAEGLLTDTGKNFTCHGFYALAAFEQIGDVWVAKAIVDVPDVIELATETAEPAAHANQKWKSGAGRLTSGVRQWWQKHR